MSHFDLTEWADFVRDVLPEDVHRAMESHLAGECPECAAVCELLSKVHRAAQADSQCQVPSEVVDAAAAIFPSGRGERPPSLTVLTAKLVFDTLNGLLPAGARGADLDSHQAAFEAGDYYLDLRFDREGAQVTLVGQLANRKAPSGSMEGMAVLVVSGEKVVGQTVTNQFGEFCLEYRPAGLVKLCIPIQHEGTQIEVALNRFSKGR